ncbi:MAG: glycosyltransferase family 39 protein [Anaerolineales bacterium]|nr:glycosyltransferase family 39 protein [Anaerolineales bacterium]
MKIDLKSVKPPLSFWLALAGVLATAAIMNTLEGRGAWLQGWLAHTTLLALGIASLWGVWRLTRGTAKDAEWRSAIPAFLSAVIVRLAVGTILFTLLPLIGYTDNAEHQSGYAFTDAFIRDQQAWELASSGEPIGLAFTDQFSGDQYGGMLALSAIVYRTLSPDAHRPLLIIILGAIAAAWGTLLTWQASRSWFGAAVANVAAWIFALYPESILLGSSQMREPFVLSAVAATFYALTRIKGKKWAWLAWLLLAVGFLFLFQPLAGIVALGVVLGIWLLGPGALGSPKHGKSLAALVLLAGVLIIAFIIVASVLANLPSLQGTGPLSGLVKWLQNNFAFQSYLMERASGMLQKMLDHAGEKWSWLVILVYGIAQPVLPAIVGDPDAAAIMRLIGFLRAAGWYLLAPFLVYGVMGALRARSVERRTQLILLSAAIWGWVAIAALNAGGDQWDNPRYRAILLTWQALLAAWAWYWARSHHDAWLWRWIAVEVVFVAMFTEWYLGRYYPNVLHLDIRVMIIVTLVISALILGGGLVWDHRKKRIHNA